MIGLDIILFTVFIALLAGAAVVGLIVFLLVSERRKAYRDFVEKNSVALAALRGINQKYRFYKLKKFNETHTYDNENFFRDISCADYLIYQLQFNSFQVVQQINLAEKNRADYAAYKAEIREKCVPGQFLLPIGKLKMERLKKAETEILHSEMQCPEKHFTIAISLYLSNMRGFARENKSQLFDEEQIISYIQRLKNKRGNFFSDRGIWDAICRVERGKVSNKMRFAIYQRDGYRCCICGRSQQFVDLEIDHIIPISKSGKSTYDNLQTLCHDCNVNKGNRIDY